MIGTQDLITSQEQDRAREEGAKKISGEEQLSDERWRRIGMLGSLRARTSEEVTQSNTSSPGGLEVLYLLRPRGDDGN